MKLLTNLSKGSHTRSKRQTWDLLQKKSVDGTVKWNPWTKTGQELIILSWAWIWGNYGAIIPIYAYNEFFDAENYWKTKKKVCFKHTQTMVSDFPK